jgi:hypothetical protein
VSGATYDSGALIAAERDDRRMWALHRRTLERGVAPTVPAGVLGQAWRGGPQPQLSRLLAGCLVEELSGPRARQAGTLMGAAGRSDVVDASVVVGALERRDVVFSGDRGDLEALAASANRRLQVLDV